MSKEVQTPFINYCEDKFVYIGADIVINKDSSERVGFILYMLVKIWQYNMKAVKGGEVARTLKMMTKRKNMVRGVSSTAR